MREWNSSPSFVTAPVARPPCTQMWSTSLPVPDIDAETLRHPLQRLREAAHRAAQVGPGAALAGGHPHGVVELDVTGAGVARPAEGADQAEGARRRLHDVRLEVVLGRVGGRPEDHELQDVIVAGLVELGGELGEGGRVAQDELVHDLAGALDHGVVDGIGLRVVLREAGDLLDRVRHVFPEDDAVLAIQKGAKERGLRLIISTPLLNRSRSLSTFCGASERTYDPVEAMCPGAPSISSEKAAPPTSLYRSRTQTLYPARAR